MKKNSEGQFREISWLEAADEICHSLENISASFGPNSLAVHMGPKVDKCTIDFYREFSKSFGTPNFSSSKSYSHLASEIARNLVYGDLLSVPDFQNSDVLVLWGANADNFSLNASDLKDKTVVVIDPCKNSFAKDADMHLPIRPGSDGALALGVLNAIIQNNQYDNAFVESCTTGFKALSEYASHFTPERVEMITWVASEDMLKLAEIYGSCSRVSTLVGKSLELQTNGVQTIRAIASLEVLSGNLESSEHSEPVQSQETNSNSLKTTLASKPVGAEEFPLFYEFSGEAQSNLYAKDILSENPSIKAMMIVGEEATSGWPNANRVREALEKLEFLVVFDSSISEVAELADLIVPFDQSELLTMLSEKFAGSSPSPDCIDGAVDWKLKTPSGKVEFESERLAEYGYDALPVYVEAAESMLTNPPNSIHIFTTTSGNSDLERSFKEDGLSVVLAHPAVFKKYHYHTGEKVKLSTNRGSFKAVLLESDEICPNTVYIQNDPQKASLLADDSILDPISGFPGARSVLVDIESV